MLRLEREMAALKIQGQYRVAAAKKKAAEKKQDAHMQAIKAAAEEERRAQELEKMRIEAEFKRAKAERELMEQRRRHEEELAKEQDEEKRKCRARTMGNFERRDAKDQVWTAHTETSSLLIPFKISRTRQWTISKHDVKGALLPAPTPGTIQELAESALSWS